MCNSNFYNLYTLILELLTSEDFYIYMDKIRLGADTPDPGLPPYFFGHLNNFRWPEPTDRQPPFVDSKIPYFLSVTILAILMVL